jgi:hypothetical protein
VLKGIQNIPLLDHLSGINTMSASNVLHNENDASSNDSLSIEM